MSKNLTIDEGGESRHFDGVKRLKTKLAGEDGGSCYWVPDDETQAWPTFIMDNGMHVAEEEGVYGFSEANVNVYIPTPFPDWDIRIDDLDIPHIHIDDITIGDWHIDDIDLTIDDIDGTPIIDMDGIDMDGFDIPDIDIHMDDMGLPISDIDFKTDIHVWTDPDDHTKIHIKEEPNGEEIVLDYDDIDGTVTFKDLIDIRYDDEEDKWIIEAHDKIKVDDVDYEAGDVIKSWSKDEIVDFTMKVEQEISVDFPDLDPDFDDDFDVELDLDNMELDMDGMDMDIDLPLLKMPDLDDKLPDEIRIMHVPNKTSYQDGEAIDLDGIVVQAYKGGAVWQNNKYVNGYIPVHELQFTPSIAKYVDGDEKTTIKESNLLGGPVECIYNINSGWKVTKKYELEEGQKGVVKTVTEFFTWSGRNSINAVCIHGDKEFYASDRKDAGGATLYYYQNYYEPGCYEEDGLWVDESSSYYGFVDYYQSTDTDGNKKGVWWRHGLLPYGPGTIEPEMENTKDLQPPGMLGDEFFGRLAWTMIYGETKEYGLDTVKISWPRPIDGMILSDSYGIKIS